MAKTNPLQKYDLIVIYTEGNTLMRIFEGDYRGTCTKSYSKPITLILARKSTPKTTLSIMIKFSIDNIFIEFEGRNFQQTVGKPMGD